MTGGWNVAMRLGNKAEGIDFFDRVTEREDLWRYLEGNHIVLTRTLATPRI